MKYAIAIIISIVSAAVPARVFAHNGHYENAGWSAVAGVGSDISGHISLTPSLRFQYPRVSSLGVELFAMMPYGLGANLHIAGIHTERFSLRLLDLGFFYGREPGNRWVEHDWSLVLGAGMEYRFLLHGEGARYAQLILDYRAFLPDPGSVLMFYGDFGREIYLGALRNGQIIFGGGVTF